MFPRLCHPLSRTCRPERSPGKLRPASHSYIPTRETLVVVTILSLCALLIYAGVWLVRLLDDLPLTP